MGKYNNIKTLSELRMEKLRLEFQIKSKEEKLDGALDRFRYQFSFSGIVDYLKVKVDSGVSILKSVASGYNFVMGVVNRFRGENKTETE